MVLRQWVGIAGIRSDKEFTIETSALKLFTFIRSVDNDKLPHDDHTFCISAHLPAAIILSKHFFITFLKSTMRLPSLSSCFSNDKLSFSDKEFDSKLSPIILAAILKLSALFSIPRSALSYLSITLVE